MEDFVHLHVHTYYSILDGQSRVQRLVDKAIGDGMKGMAITDHGNMFGIKEFYNYCKGINKNVRRPVRSRSSLFWDAKCMWRVAGKRIR